jgi:predicted RNase H-like HicB family nuclease
MLQKYIEAALARANYEALPDGEGYYGEIDGFQGLWANADTLEACREELSSALEDWILLSVERHLPLPVVDGIQLWPRPSVATPGEVA